MNSRSSAVVNPIITIDYLVFNIAIYNRRPEQRFYLKTGFHYNFHPWLKKIMGGSGTYTVSYGTVEDVEYPF